jgi:6-phospho-3-hexuloisomerase
MRPIDVVLTEILNELTQTLQAISSEDAAAFQEIILAASRIFVAGKGRSGFQMRGFAMRLMHLELTTHFLDDVVTPAIRDNDLLVIGSGSGRTASLLQYAIRAKELGATLVLLTIDTASPIAELADCVVHIKASTPKLEKSEPGRSIQPMGTLFEQALGIFLDAIALQLMQRLGRSESAMFERHANLE